MPSHPVRYPDLHARWRSRAVRRPVGRCSGSGELEASPSISTGCSFLIGDAAWGWASGDRRAPLGLWVMAHVVAGLLLLPYGWQITHQVRPERLVGVTTPGFGAEQRLRGHTTLHPMALPYTAYAFATGYSLGPTLEELREDPGAAARPRHLPLLALVGLAFGVPLVFGIWRAGGPGRGLLLAPPCRLVTVWLAAANMKPYNVRYLSVLLPAFLLFAAVGCWRLPRRWGATTAATMLVIGLVSSWNYLFVARYGRDDVRGAVAYVADHASPDDAIVQISLTGALRYYYDRLGKRPVHPPASATASPDAARAWLDSQLAGRKVAWYLECRPQGIDPGGVLRKTLQSMSHTSTTTSVVGIRIHRFDLDPLRAGVVSDPKMAPASAPGLAPRDSILPKSPR